MSDPRERPSRFPWPPAIYLAAIAAAILLSLAVPLPWLGSPLADLLFAIGWIVLVVVVLLDVTAMRTLSRARTTVMPTRAAEHLVTSGPFAVSRNPIYLANTLLLIGVGLVAGWIWFFVLAIIAALATQKLAIEPEEKHLYARFGKKYLDYKKKVRRWV